MILADTSIWVDHFRSTSKELQKHLMRQQIFTHPFIVGELGLEPLRERGLVLALLDRLPQAEVAQPGEVRHMIETRGLFGLGISWIDAHLLASAFMTPSTLLWTRHKPLRRIAELLGVHVTLR